MPLTASQMAELAAILAKLRHAYSHLYAGTVIKQRELAVGLIHPAIVKLEKLADELA